jgi:cyclophilin family peptidyl-prolyl cis-trans isomerase/HEAT repeat protein
MRRALAVLACPLLVAAAPAKPAAPQAVPGSRGEKMARILALEDRRSTGDGTLDRLLADGDRGVRRRAALAAGRIGDPSMAAALVARMNDTEPEVRQMSAFALGLLGDPVAAERLVAALADADPVVRARAVEALGRVGGPRAAPAIVEAVRAALPADAPVVTVRGDDPGSARDPWLLPRLGLFALVRLKDVAAAESVLLADGRPRFDWWAATWAAMRLENAALKPVLVASLKSSDPVARALAARGLGALKDAASFDAAAPLVKDADAQVVIQAIRAVGAMADARGVALLTPLLKSPSPVVKSEALAALSLLPPERTLRPSVVAFVGDPDPAVRGAALRALSRLDREEFALVLSGLDPDPERSVRAARAAALGEAGDEISLGILAAMLKDEDPGVLPAVLEAIRKAKGVESADLLRRHLEHADPAVRGAAAEGLAALGTAGVAPALQAAWKRSLADTDLEARLAIVDALAAQKDDASAGALKEVAGSDPARVVRARASAALKARGQEAVWPGFEPASRTALDYRLAMAPYEPGAGQELFTPRAIVHTRHGRVEIHLDIVEAPLTSASFMELARRGFYNGLPFHRVVPGFVVQGGDPRGDGSGGPGYTVRCEIGQRFYGRGAVGMALSGKDTGGSQFFVAESPQPHLDGGYTIFGWVAAGMEVVDQIRPGDLIEKVEIWSGR